MIEEITLQIKINALKLGEYLYIKVLEEKI